MVAVTIVALAVGFLLVAALMRGFGSGAPAANAGGAPDASPAGQQQQARREPEPAPRASPGGVEARDDSSLSRILGDESQQQPAQGARRDLLMTFATVTVRLTLAALLSAMLAYRPRRFSRSIKRNPFVAQTQILLAVVASALMMIVGDSTARAFGIFAAVSLVRFRTNIKDPKEITVLLLSLAIGLATGVGRWEIGIILTFFVLLLLWGLEYREPEQVTRAMELTVKTRNIGTTQDSLLQLFRKYDFAAEMRSIDRPDKEDEAGCVVYYVDVSPQVSIDRMSEELLAADPKNIDGVVWDQQKNTSYFYQ
jgi:uncharacterized membrane protein YhiD involved in acid resistance